MAPSGDHTLAVDTRLGTEDRKSASCVKQLDVAVLIMVNRH